MSFKDTCDAWALPDDPVDLSAIVCNLPLYLEGLWVTIQLVAMALALGLLLAVPVALLASSKKIWVKALPQAFIYFFRGTPLLVQMFMIYYGRDAAGFHRTDLVR
jgi:His/Glu/Gln/Arg/opine family amino acid ABC transporter permease subunit